MKPRMLLLCLLTACHMPPPREPAEDEGRTESVSTEEAPEPVAVGVAVRWEYSGVRLTPVFDATRFQAALGAVGGEIVPVTPDGIGEQVLEALGGPGAPGRAAWLQVMVPTTWGRVRELMGALDTAGYGAVVLVGSNRALSVPTFPLTPVAICEHALTLELTSTGIQVTGVEGEVHRIPCVDGRLQPVEQCSSPERYDLSKLPPLLPPDLSQRCPDIVVSADDGIDWRTVMELVGRTSPKKPVFR